MHSIDLEVSPVERTIRVVMVNLTCALGILGALDRQCHSRGRAKLLARILLVCSKAPTVLVSLCGGSFFARRSEADDQWRLEVDPHRPLQAECVAVQRNTDDRRRD